MLRLEIDNVDNTNNMRQTFNSLIGSIIRRRITEEKDNLNQILLLKMQLIILCERRATKQTYLIFH